MPINTSDKIITTCFNNNDYYYKLNIIKPEQGRKAKNLRITEGKNGNK